MSGLTEAERVRLGLRIFGDRVSHTEEAILAVLAAREAALRESITALADEWQRIHDERGQHLGCLQMYQHCATELRALLARGGAS